MKKSVLLIMLMFLCLVGKQTFATEVKATLAPPVTLSTEPLVAASISQGSTFNLVYKVKVISTEAFTLNNITFKTSGTFTSGNIPAAYLYDGGNNFLASISSTVTAGGNLSFNISQNIPANTAFYFNLQVNVSSTAANGNIVKIDGGLNPVTLTSTLSTLTIVNNQTDIAGPFTIVSPNITLSTEPLPAVNISKGSFVPIYILKITTDKAFTFNSANLKFLGDFVGGDLLSIGYGLHATPDPTSTTICGGGFAATTFSNGGTFNFYMATCSMPANSVRYLIVTIQPSSTAIVGHTVKINGSTNPMTFTSSSSTPIITNNQADIAGLQTIVDPLLTLSTEVTPSANVLPLTYGTAYILKLLSPTAQNLSGFTFNLTGTFSNTDIGGVLVNQDVIPSPVNGITLGASRTGNVISTAGISLVANVPKYIIVRTYISSTGVSGRTIRIDGSTNPVTVSATVAPTITNNQTDVAGVLTITGPSLIVTTEPTAVASITPNNSGTVYKIKVIPNKTLKIDQLSLKIGGNFTAGKVIFASLHESNSSSSIGTAISTLNSFTTLTKTSGDVLTFSIGISYGYLTLNTAMYYTVVLQSSNILPDAYNFKVDGTSNMLAISSTANTTLSVINNQTDIAGTQSVLAIMPSSSSSRFGALTSIISTEKTIYYNTAFNEILTTVKANPQITGLVQGSVWTTGGNTLNYVSRHYDIQIPSANATSTYTMTLYFTQAEFDSFNAISSQDIPTSGSDAIGKANLRIKKYAGTYTGAGGLVYAGALTDIDPDDNKILFQNGRWEITFDTIGSGGFFVGSNCTSMYSVQSGNWNNAATWSCGRLPLATEPVQIAPTHTVTLNANGTAKSLDLRGILQKQTGFSLQIQGN